MSAATTTRLPAVGATVTVRPLRCDHTVTGTVLWAGPNPAKDATDLIIVRDGATVLHVAPSQIVTAA